MIRRFCDICGREIDENADVSRLFYGGTSVELDFCEDCKDGYRKFREELHDKYNKQFNELQAKEMEELNKYIGKDIFGLEKNNLEGDLEVD